MGEGADEYVGQFTFDLKACGAIGATACERLHPFIVAVADGHDVIDNRLEVGLTTAVHRELIAFGAVLITRRRCT